MPSSEDRQANFSRFLPGAMYDKQGREEKGRKILAVLSEFLSREMTELIALDVGCSTGIIDHFLAGYFKMLVGLDIDEEALRYATKNRDHNVHFLLSDAMVTPFKDQSFDVIICAHVYEHVPCAETLTEEIYRLLKPNGVCFFAAANRLVFYEPHYRLPFLSIIPKRLADFYLRGLGRASSYYEKLQTYWGIKKLFSRFRVVDFTMDIIANPEKYSAAVLCKPGSVKQRAALLTCRIAYWAVPTYIFLLQKKRMPSG
jgi:ubiquinone/menaquinone biosynthesis C-methylase UbiE